MNKFIIPPRPVDWDRDMVSTNIEEITPQKAEQLLKLNTNNRPLNERSVKYYAEQMTKGLWQLNGEPIIISLDNTILDGQHRLQAVVNSNVTISALVVRGIRQDAFLTIDTGRARVSGDIFTIGGVRNGGAIASAVSRYCALRNNSVYSAASHAGPTLERSNLSKCELLSLYLANKNSFDTAVSFADKFYKEARLLTRSVMGAYISYLLIDKSHDIDTIVAFFDAAVNGTRSDNETLRTLHRALVNNAACAKKLTSPMLHAYIAKSWNAYVRGRSLKRLSYNPDTDGRFVALL